MFSKRKNVWTHWHSIGESAMTLPVFPLGFRVILASLNLIVLLHSAAWPDDPPGKNLSSSARSSSWIHIKHITAWLDHPKPLWPTRQPPSSSLFPSLTSLTMTNWLMPLVDKQPGFQIATWSTQLCAWTFPSWRSSRCQSAWLDSAVSAWHLWEWWIVVVWLKKRNKKRPYFKTCTPQIVCNYIYINIKHHITTHYTLNFEGVSGPWKLSLRPHLRLPIRSW